jgi:hypothetical protein
VNVVELPERDPIRDLDIATVAGSESVCDRHRLCAPRSTFPEKAVN